MTREEAITKLKKICHNCEKFPTCVNNDKECFKALELAIKALEQEPKTDIEEKIHKMKSEIADALEFWDYSPNKNPLARDMLETITYFWGEVNE